MAKYVVATERVLSRGESGGVAFTWIARDKAALLMDKTQHAQNELLRDAMQRAADLWLAVYLPLRYTRYAYSLGYTVATKYAAKKRAAYGDDFPLVGPPSLLPHLIDQYQAAHAEARSVRSAPTATIRIPAGHPIAAIVTATLRTIPSREIDSMVREFDASLEAFLNGRERPPIERKPPRKPTAAYSRFLLRGTPGTRARARGRAA